MQLKYIIKHTSAEILSTLNPKVDASVADATSYLNEAVNNLTYSLDKAGLVLITNHLQFINLELSVLEWVWRNSWRNFTVDQQDLRFGAAAVQHWRNIVCLRLHLILILRLIFYHIDLVIYFWINKKLLLRIQYVIYIIEYLLYRQVQVSVGRYRSRISKALSL